MADLSGFEPRLCAVAYIYYIYHSSYFAVTSSLSPEDPFKVLDAAWCGSGLVFLLCFLIPA